MATRRWTSTAAASEVPKLRREVSAFAREQGLDEERVDDVRLAVTEIVTNAILHAFPDGAPAGQIEVEASVTPEGFDVRIRDDGCGLRPRTDSPGAGFGLSIVGATARELSFARPDSGGTEVRLSFAG